MKYYNIQAISRLCGISAHCIRAWEKRYGAIKPQRLDNGRRVYTDQELRRLSMLVKLSTLGNSIGLIANLPDEELERLLDKMDDHRRLVTPTQSPSLIPPEMYLNNMLMALHSYKLDVLTHELNKASMDLSCRDFSLEVVAKLFKRVGELVHTGRMSISQEHTLTAITKFFIGRRIGKHYESPRKSRMKVVLATPPGEDHTIGLMLSALLMAEYGIDLVYLGDDLPPESIAEAARATNANVVLMSVSSFYASRKPSITEHLQKLHELLPGMKLWIGGAVDQINLYRLQDIPLTTFSLLSDLDAKLRAEVEL